jgi:hypothetical protein
LNLHAQISMLDAISLFEMVIYGKGQGTPPPPPAPIPLLPAPLMGSFIGINSFVTEPLERQNAAGWIREYHDWQWDEVSGQGSTFHFVLTPRLLPLNGRYHKGAADPCYPHAQVDFSPDYSSFQSDPFYKSRTAAGIKTHVCLQGRPLCQFGGPSPNNTIAKWKAVDNNAMIGTPKTMDPSSYSQVRGQAEEGRVTGVKAVRTISLG